MTYSRWNNKISTRKNTSINIKVSESMFERTHCSYSPVNLGFDLEEIVRETILVFLSPRYILEYTDKKGLSLIPHARYPKTANIQYLGNRYCYGPYFRLKQCRICTFLWVCHTIHRCKMNRYGWNGWNGQKIVKIKQNQPICKISGTISMNFISGLISVWQN